MSSNSNGMIFVEMSPELAAFVIENCDSNLMLGLKLLDPTGPFELSGDKLRETVEHCEKFKMLKRATERALR